MDRKNLNSATEKGKLGQLIGLRRMKDREQITLDRVQRTGDKEQSRDTGDRGL